MKIYANVFGFKEKQNLGLLHLHSRISLQCDGFPRCAANGNDWSFRGALETTVGAVDYNHLLRVILPQLVRIEL